MSSHVSRSEQDCYRCRFAVRIISDDNKVLHYECRRKPPVILPVHLETSQGTWVNNTTGGHWPTVEKYDWCGEWSFDPDHEHDDRPAAEAEKS